MKPIFGIFFGDFSSFYFLENDVKSLLGVMIASRHTLIELYIMIHLNCGDDIKLVIFMTIESFFFSGGFRKS